MPTIAQNTLDRIQEMLASAITELEIDLDQLIIEMDSVTADAVRANPEGFRGIPIIGASFRADEVRTQVARVARQIQALAERIRTGTGKPYLTERQAEAVTELSTRATDLAAYAREFQTQPIPVAHQQLSDEHLAYYVSGIREAIENVESRIVTAEGALVPVSESGEGPSTVGIVVGVGLVVLVGLFVFDVI